MIEKVRLVDYRCFRDVTVELAPLTVLVGPNAAGKSSFLSSLAPTFPPNGLRRVRGVNLEQARVEVHGFGWKGPRVSLAPVIGGRRAKNDEEQRSFVLQPHHLEVPACQEHVTPSTSRRLAYNGADLANVIFNLPRDEQAAYSDEFCRYVPSFSSVEPKGQMHGTIGLEFRDRWNRDAWYKADEVSDGTILTAAYLALKYQGDRPQVVTIEEPERGLHPALLGHVVEVLRGLTRNGIQVILATHSATLLDHVEPHEVRFFRRDPSSGEVQVEVAPAGHEEWSAYLRAFDDSLGNAWLSGGLGG